VISIAALGVAALHESSWQHFTSSATGSVRIENIAGPQPGATVIPESRQAVLDFYGEAAPPWRDPRLSWLGYGWGQYVSATGLVRPHNVFVLGAYELGLFGLVLVCGAGWCLWKGVIPWRIALVLLALWQLVEEPLGRPEGLYLTAAVLWVHWRR
jgi:hypothetical protein